MKVIAIIPAAGLGTRMAGASGAVKASGAAAKPAPSKQFAELGGVPIIIHTLRKFVGAPRIEQIYVALRGAEQEQFRARLAQENFSKPIHLVEGGEHRQESVANAINAVEAYDDDIVLVHDAVRPFVDQEITIKLVDRSQEGALITSTVPRERAVLAQTPQGFRFGLLRKAMAEATADGFTGTDEASLLERSGHEVAVVMGSPRNLKITTPGDLELAEFYINKR